MECIARKKTWQQGWGSGRTAPLEMSQSRGTPSTLNDWTVSNEEVTAACMAAQSRISLSNQQ
jgi:hypothetical protein